MSHLRELPPTSGLPPKWWDLFSAEKNFEEELQKFLGVDFVQVECSGTAAFLTALVALRQLSGRRKVIIPAYTCPLVALAIKRAGLKIVLCDLASDHFDLDMDALGALIDEDTLCVVPTHLGGLASDIHAIGDVAHRQGAFVIEDTAQAMGTRLGDRAAGTLGDVGFFSFAAGKGLTTFEGGALVAANRKIQNELQRAAQSLSAPNRVLELRRSAQLAGYMGLYNPLGLSAIYGAPLRSALEAGDAVGAVGDKFDIEIPLHEMGAWRKRIGATQMARLPEHLAGNRQRAMSRLKELGEVEGMTVLKGANGTEATWPFFTVLCQSRELRDAVMDRLWTQGLGVTRLFIHDLTGYDYLDTIVPRYDVPNARSFAERTFTISNSPFVTDDDFARIKDALVTIAGTSATVETAGCV